MFAVDRAVSNRVVEEGVLLSWVNRELVPTLQKLRAAHNALAAFLSSSTDTEFVMDMPTGIAFSVQYNGTTRFKVDATGISFFGATPAARPAAYTVTNPSTRRSFDTTTVTTQQLAEVVGTIIADLKAYGVLQ